MIAIRDEFLVYFFLGGRTKISILFLKTLANNFRKKDFSSNNLLQIKLKKKQ